MKPTYQVLDLGVVIKGPLGAGPLLAPSETCGIGANKRNIALADWTRRNTSAADWSILRVVNGKKGGTFGDPFLLPVWGLHLI